MPDKKLTVDEFALKIKSQYPEYKDIDNFELATKIIEKYPQYGESVELKKKDQPISQGFGIGSEPSQPYRPSVLQPGVEPVYGEPNQVKPKTVAEAQKEKPVKLSKEYLEKRGDLSTQALAPFMADLNRATAGFYKLPKLAYNTIAAPQNLVAELMNRPDLKANYDAISKGTYNPLNVIDKIGDYSLGVASDWQEKQKKYDKSITDNILSGNFQQAGEQLSDNITGSIPSLLSMYLTGGAASANKLNKISSTFAKAAPFASTKSEEIQNNPNIPDYLKPLNSWMTGLSEVVYEEAFGTKSIIDNAISVANNKGKQAGVEALYEVLKPATVKILSKAQPITNVIANGIEEGVTQISQNIIDKYTGVDPNRDIMDGVSDAIIVGSAQGLGATAVGKGIEYIADPKRSQRVKDLQNTRVAIIDDLDNDAVPEDTKIDLDNKLTEINEQINTELAANREELKSIPTELAQEANRLQTEIESKEESVASEALSQQSKQIINEDVSNLKTELNKVNKKIKDAVQKQAAGQVPVQPEAQVGGEVAQGEPQAKPQEVAEGSEEKVGKKLPAFTSKFEAVDVIDYTKPEINKYRPSEQLKFNQGTFEPVRVVGEEDLITLVQAGSERQLKLDGKKRIKKIPDNVVADLESKYGITAIEAYERARDIAKSSRDKNTERIVVLGDKIAAPKEKISTKQDVISTIKEDLKNKPSEYATLETVLNDDGSTAVRLIPQPNAKKLTGYAKGLDLFYHKTENGNIVISDKNIGARIVQAPTLKEAKQKLDDLITRNGGVDKFTSALSAKSDDLIASIVDKYVPVSEQALPETKVAKTVEAKAPEAKPVDLASKIRALKVKTDKSKLQANLAGLPVALYNSAIEFIATSVEAGMSISDAINKAIVKYKLDKRKSFNEDEFKKSILGVEEEDKGISIKNEDVARRRADYGFEPRVEPETRSFSTVEQEAKDAIKAGKSVYAVIEKARSGATLSDVEQAMLGLFQAQKEAEILAINEKLENMGDAPVAEFTSEQSKKDAAMVDLLSAYDASEIAGTNIARALNIRKMRVLQDYSLAGIIARQRIVKNNQPLTRSELSAAEKVYAKIKKAQELLDAKMKKLNEEQSKAKLQKTLPVLVEEAKFEQRQQKREVTKEEIKAERESIKNEISKILKNSRSELGANKIPVELIPALAKLAKNYIKEGIVNIDQLVDKVHTDLSEYITDLSKADVKRALSNYDKENRPTKEQLLDKARKARLAQDKIAESEKLSKKAAKAKKEGKTEDAEDYQKLADDLIDQVDEIATEEGIEVPDKRLESYKDRLRKRINEIRTKIENKDFSKAERDEIKLDSEAIKLKKELDKIKFDYEVQLAKEELANRNELEKIRDAAIDIIGVPRAIMATADYSAPLRQAAVATVAYPKIAKEATKEMFKQAIAPEYAEQWLSDLYASPGYQLMKESGLYIADLQNPKLTAKEEEYTTNLATKIPGFGELVKESERAYVAYLNKMRTDIFSIGVEIMQNNGKSFATHPNDFKQLAKYVNDITGRGNLPKWISGAAPALNAVYFSPRLIISRLRLLSQFFWMPFSRKIPIEVKKMYAKDMGLFFAFGSAVMLAFAAAGADVEEDPRSSDFGKIRYGDTRWDIWAGFQQPIRAFAQSISGSKKSTATGKITELKPGEGFDPLKRFLRSKLAPVPALVYDAYSGTDMMGVPFNLKESLIEMSSPLVLQGAVESMNQDGILFGIGATFLPSQLGIGVQTYSTNDFLKQGPDDKIIKLLRDKKAIAIEPYDITRKVYDEETGEERRMTSDEFKIYYQTWADHIKNVLDNNMSEYKSMSNEEFEKEFNKIKNQATTIAKEKVTGISSSMKTVKVTIDGDVEYYELTPDEVKFRKNLNDEFIAKNQSIFSREYNRALRDGKSPYEAEIEANKELTRRANEYSKKTILRMHKSGKGYDFEK